jgi:hypothetical protein
VRVNLRLFHQIGEGGEDSAAVRQFLVDNKLTEMVEFANVAYDGSKAVLCELIGHVEAPVLVAHGRPICGRELILDWLRTNVLAQRE